MHAQVPRTYTHARHVDMDGRMHFAHIHTHAYARMHPLPPVGLAPVYVCAHMLAHTYSRTDAHRHVALVVRAGVAYSSDVENVY